MSLSSKEEGSAVPPQSKGSWSSFLKSIASFNGDLSSLTAPPFILGTTSLTEFSAYWTEHPSIFVAPAAEPDPAKRALLVLKWFLTSLKSSYCSRSDKFGSEKKPLNPFLGEFYLGKWEDEAGVTHLVSEQVSHHPPVTAYCIWNDKHGVEVQGYNGQKASFSRTIHIKQVGHALLTLKSHNNETYLITLPNIHIENLIYGKPFVELNTYSSIVSSSGYTAKIDYAGRGWLSGKKNTFTATLHPTGKEKEILYTIEGQWSEAFTIKQGGGSALSKAKSAPLESYNANSVKTTTLSVRPVEEQDPYESNKAWKKVAEGITKGDMDLVSHEKGKIENAQRERRRKEAAEGREWPRKFFKREKELDPAIEKLAKSVGEQISPDRTNGIWRFDESTKSADAEGGPKFEPTPPGEGPHTS